MSETAASSFYEILGVAPDATADVIRRAYLRRARECHPDKNTDADAKERFQSLQHIYVILSSPQKRAAYDAGEDDEVMDGRFGAPKITEEDIYAFARTYLGSDVEREDLLQNYRTCKGKMEQLFKMQILSKAKFDAHRFVDILDGAVGQGEIRSYKSYETWRGHVLKTPRREVSFEKRFKKSKASTVSDLDELALIEKIQNRGAKHMAFVNELKTRFCGNGPTPYDEITEEEFQDAQSRLLRTSAEDKKHNVKVTKTKGVQKRRSKRLARKSRR